MNNLLACRRKTCEVYNPGVGWRQENYTLLEKRSSHTSWSLSNGSVVLLGGGFSDQTTEVVTPGVGTGSWD